MQNHCCNLQTTWAQLFMMMGPGTLVLSPPAGGPCARGVYAAGPSGLIGRLELYVPSAQGTLVVSSFCMF